eukprot:CAMPEP_0197892308 /NCGR_PEP_ID=MMETSP1439-20131203/30076_1 /TAXON_ID=66791 /ORGANISM="Gonyaulax spinifera, Strain CCMP409" /LENGTH=167 /DNA_ID=CAMNT_0043512467 /DNA_START=46 /DNA_END=551 /DNA_ORIENTATION=-
MPPVPVSNGAQMRSAPVVSAATLRALAFRTSASHSAQVLIRLRGWDEQVDDRNDAPVEDEQDGEEVDGAGQEDGVAERVDEPHQWLGAAHLRACQRPRVRVASAGSEPASAVKVPTADSSAPFGARGCCRKAGARSHWATAHTATTASMPASSPLRVRLGAMVWSAG